MLYLYHVKQVARGFLYNINQKCSNFFFHTPRILRIGLHIVPLIRLNKTIFKISIHILKNINAPTIIII